LHITGGNIHLRTNLSPPTSSSQCQLAFEKNRALHNKSICPLSCRESEKSTDSFTIVQQEVHEVDKDVESLPPNLSSCRVIKKVKVEAIELTVDII
jgi:hypothetical protein